MAENGTTLPSQTEDHSMEEMKGKGKATAENVPQDDNMNEEEEDSDSSDEENENEEPAAEEDGMEEIDLNNIVEGGRRTRGQQIDFAKAAEQHPAEEDEEDEDDDDFRPADEDTQMAD